MTHSTPNPFDQQDMLIQQIATACDALKQGQVVAYPTEAVFGLGCDPFNQAAVAQVCALKNRDSAKGLILIASDWSQVEPLVASMSDDQLNTIHASWPGPVTWVFPASNQAPHAVCAPDNTIAVRITDHPTAHQLCRTYGRAIVSTSANQAGQPPFTDAQSVKQSFPSSLLVIDAPVGSRSTPSDIFRAETGEQLR